jgi:hypothetical protein
MARDARPPHGDEDPDPEYLRVARSQLDGVEDHCESARRSLDDLRGSLAGAEREVARDTVGRVLDEQPPLAERCRAIRTNTFDPLERQLSKLVVSTPEAAGDLTAGCLDDSMAELGQHHDRLMAAVGRLEDLTRGDRFDTAAARRAVEDGIRAIDHIDSTASLLQCLLAKGAPLPADAREGVSTGGTAPDAEFAVSGTITHGETPLDGVTVRAFDRDLDGEEPLGEATTDPSGAYRITYGEADFARNERGTADVVVDVFNEVGARLGGSAVHYNAGHETTVDLQIPPEREVVPSEYALLRSELDPLLSGRSVTAVSNDQLEFLTNELNLPDRERFPAGEGTLDLLRTATELASRTPFQVRTLYALTRTTSVGDRRSLARSDPSTLADRIRTADAENVVDVRIEGLEDRLARKREDLRRLLELEAGEETRTTVEVVTVDDDPLVGVTVRVQDPEDERRRRSFSTGEDGTVTFSYMRPSDERSRRFHLTVTNDAGVTLHEETVAVGEGGATTITMPAYETGFSGGETLRSLRSERGLQLPRLDGDAELTLGSIRRAGGVENLDGSATADRGTRDAIDGISALDLLTDPETSRELVRQGYTDQRSIAGTPLAEFQSTMHGTLGGRQAATVHATAQAQTYLLDSVQVDRRAGLRNGTRPVDGEFQRGVNDDG